MFLSVCVTVDVTLFAASAFCVALFASSLYFSVFFSALATLSSSSSILSWSDSIISSCTVFSFLSSWFSVSLNSSLDSVSFKSSSDVKSLTGFCGSTWPLSCEHFVKIHIASNTTIAIPKNVRVFLLFTKVLSLEESLLITLLSPIFFLLKLSFGTFGILVFSTGFETGFSTGFSTGFETGFSTGFETGFSFGSFGIAIFLVVVSGFSEYFSLIFFLAATTLRLNWIFSLIAIYIATTGANNFAKENTFLSFCSLSDVVNLLIFSFSFCEILFSSVVFSGCWEYFCLMISFLRLTLSLNSIFSLIIAYNATIGATNVVKENTFLPSPSAFSICFLFSFSSSFLSFLNTESLPDNIKNVKIAVRIITSTLLKAVNEYITAMQIHAVIYCDVSYADPIMYLKIPLLIRSYCSSCSSVILFVIAVVIT